MLENTELINEIRAFEYDKKMQMRQSIQSFETPMGDSQSNKGSMVTPGNEEDAANEELMVNKISELEEIVR